MCCYWCCCCCCCCRYLATYNPILFALCRTQTSTFQASGSWMRVTVSVCMFRRGITSTKINKKSIKPTRRTAGVGSLPNGAQRLHFPFLARALQGLAGSWQKKIERSDLFFFLFIPNAPLSSPRQSKLQDYEFIVLEMETNSVYEFMSGALHCVLGKAQSARSVLVLVPALSLPIGNLTIDKLLTTDRTIPCAPRLCRWQRLAGVSYWSDALMDKVLHRYAPYCLKWRLTGTGTRRLNGNSSNSSRRKVAAK